MRKYLIAATLVVCASPAFSQTSPIVTKAPAYTFGSPCTVSPLSCTGFYAGAFIGGVATNIDVLGSGLNNSIFAGGEVPAFNVGWQYAVNNYYFAIEAGAGYQFSTIATVGAAQGNQNGILGYQEVQAGLGLAGLLGTQTPVPIPSGLASQVIAPYVALGIVERPWGQGMEAGAGVKIDLTQHMLLDLRYRYITYNGAAANNGNAQFNGENIVSIGAEYKF
jgi:opacity protein-like surface antigen